VTRARDKPPVRWCERCGSRCLASERECYRCSAREARQKEQKGGKTDVRIGDVGAPLREPQRRA
jgi:hypothetical protein